MEAFIYGIAGLTDILILMTFDSISIIYNLNSTGDSVKNAKELKTELTKLFPKLGIQLCKTRYVGHAQKLAFEISNSSRLPLIISSSGDGGYNEVINGAIQAQSKGAKPICAVLASGNANDHSRTLQKDALIKSINNNKVRHIDVLKIRVTNTSIVDEKYAHSYIGLGLTPEVAAELNKTDLNVLKEFIIVLRTFYKYKPIKIKRNGKLLKLDSIIFANIGEMAKVLTISKNSKPNDGFFEVVSFKHNRKMKLVSKLVKATVIGLDTPKKTKSYSFTVLKNMPAQLDGEVMKIKAQSSVLITSEYQLLRTII